MTWLQFVGQYVREHGSIVPAMLEGTPLGVAGKKISTQLGKRCRELRARGILISPPESKVGNMERFYLNPDLLKMTAGRFLVNKDYTEELEMWKVKVGARQESFI